MNDFSNKKIVPVIFFSIFLVRTGLKKNVMLISTKESEKSRKEGINFFYLYDFFRFLEQQGTEKKLKNLFWWVRGRRQEGGG